MKTLSLTTRCMTSCHLRCRGGNGERHSPACASVWNWPPTGADMALIPNVTCTLIFSLKLEERTRTEFLVLQTTPRHFLVFFFALLQK